MLEYLYWTQLIVYCASECNAICVDNSVLLGSRITEVGWTIKRESKQIRLTFVWKCVHTFGLLPARNHSHVAWSLLNSISVFYIYINLEYTTTLDTLFLKCWIFPNSQSPRTFPKQGVRQTTCLPWRTQTASYHWEHYTFKCEFLPEVHKPRNSIKSRRCTYKKWFNPWVK